MLRNIVWEQKYEMRLATPVPLGNRSVRTITWFIHDKLSDDLSLSDLIRENRAHLTRFYDFRLSQSESLPKNYQYQRASTSRYPFIVYNNLLEFECICVRFDFEDGRIYEFIPGVRNFYRFIIRLIFGDLQNYLLESSFGTSYFLSEEMLYDSPHHYWHRQYRSQQFIPQSGSAEDIGIWYRACLDPVFLDVLRTLLRDRFAHRDRVSILELSSGFGFFSAKLVRLCAEEFPCQQFMLVFGDKPDEAFEATRQRVVSIVRAMGARNLQVEFLHGDAVDVLPPCFEKERFDIVFSEGGVLGAQIESLENNLRIYDTIVGRGFRDEESMGVYSGLEPYFIPSENTSATFRPYAGVANFDTANLQFFTFLTGTPRSTTCGPPDQRSMNRKRENGIRIRPGSQSFCEKKNAASSPRMSSPRQYSMAGRRKWKSLVYASGLVSSRPKRMSAWR